MITDILISPMAGAFDLEQVKNHLTSMPNTTLDPVAGKTYMLASSEEQLEDAIAARVANPRRFPYSVALVSAVPARITVAFRNPRNVASARHFVQWLRSSYEVRITDEAFKDITAECDERLEYIFGPST